MGYRDIPNNLDDLEHYIDGVLSKLRIYHLPLYTALLHFLTVFEGRFDFVYYPKSIVEAMMLYTKDSLQTLIPQLFRYCPRPTFVNRGASPTLDELTDARDAMKFCERYGIAAHCFTQYHQKWYVGAVKDRVATFAYLDGTDVGRAQLNLTLHKYHEDRTISQSAKVGRLWPSVPVEESKMAMQIAIKLAEGNMLYYSLPDKIYIPFREIAESTLPKPTIEGGTRCTNYTVDDYYRLWLEFATLAMIHCFACDEKYSAHSPYSVPWARVMHFKLADLGTILAKRGNVDYQLAMHILSDLVLDLKTSRPDVLVQPLIPIPESDIVMIPPSLIYTSNWEVCLLRNWIIRYPDVYGHVVAQKKEKLADEFGKLFDSNRFKVSTRKKLKNRQGRIIGDVDTAVFDPTEGYLAIFELKWLIEPDSMREAMKADREISKGIEQVLLMKSEFDGDVYNFLNQVFPGCGITPAKVKELRPFVIGHGDVGGQMAAQSNMPVLDYFLTLEILQKYANRSLREILTLMLQQQQRLSEATAKKYHPMQVKLAGFLFRLPGYGDTRELSIFHNPSKPNLRRNDRCLCGSGIKYKDCCWELKDYIEDAF